MLNIRSSATAHTGHQHVQWEKASLPAEGAGKLLMDPITSNPYVLSVLVLWSLLTSSSSTSIHENLFGERESESVIYVEFVELARNSAQSTDSEFFDLKLNVSDSESSAAFGFG